MESGAADIGQGSSTLLTQVVAEVLSLPMARIRVVATDSVLTPKDNEGPLKNTHWI